VLDKTKLVGRIASDHSNLTERYVRPIFWVYKGTLDPLPLQSGDKRLFRIQPLVQSRPCLSGLFRVAPEVPRASGPERAEEHATIFEGMRSHNDGYVGSISHKTRVSLMSLIHRYENTYLGLVCSANISSWIAGSISWLAKPAEVSRAAITIGSSWLVRSYHTTETQNDASSHKLDADSTQCVHKHKCQSIATL
jgi:hypothetical protein